MHRVTSWIALATLVLAAFARASAAGSDPRLIPLVDQHGTAFRLADLGGKTTIITFVATRCTDACPIADGEFVALAKKLRADRVQANVLSITLDPTYDTPFVMSQFAKAFGPDVANWRLVSGEAAGVRNLMNSFGVVTKLNHEKIPEQHSSFIYVLDRHVRLAKSFLLSNRLADDVEPEARRLDARTQ